MNTATFTATLTDKQIAQAMAAISATGTADQVAIFGALEDELTTRRPSIAQKFDAVYDEGLRGAALLRALATTAINSIAK